MKGHGGVAIIVRFLDPGLPLAIDHQTPNVARPLRSDLEFRSVVTKTRHPRAIKLLLLAAGGADLAVIEGALGHPDPATRSACELMGKKMRVLHPETAQDDLALVCFSVAISVFQEHDFGTMLDVNTVSIRQNAQRNGEAFGKDARWRQRSRPIRPIPNQHLVFGFAGVKLL